MSEPHTLWAYFDGDLQAARAVQALRDADTEFTLFAPYMTHELEHALARPASRVRLFVLAGGLLGCAAGFTLTIWTATRWNLIVGGKPIVAIPPYLVIAFELTLLFGALAAVLGFLLLGRLPRRRHTPGYDPSLSAGRFALRVAAAAERVAEIRARLHEAGAAEVRSGTEAAGEVQHG